MLGTQPVVYVLQSLQWQLSPFPDLIWFLKIGSVLTCLTTFGNVDQSLFPRKDIVSITYVVV